MKPRYPFATHGRRSTGLALSKLPGLVPSRASAWDKVNPSGTNRSSTTTVLLPVPRMPIVSQVSSIVYWRLSIRK